MEQTAKQLITAFAEGWEAQAPALLGRATALRLLALREVSGEGRESALAVANTWSSAFAAECSGALTGVIVFLFKSDEVGEIERLVKTEPDGLPKPGGRELVNRAFGQAAASLGEQGGAPVTFGPAAFIDLAADESRLSSMVGDGVWFGTFSLNVGDDLDTQALLLYAPGGTLGRASAQKAAATQAASPAVNNAGATAAAPAAQPSPSRRQQTARREELPRNIDRLLEVELDVVVRFGVTNLPLRELARMGIGTMLELNRAIDEPVELLVNGRQLARGEVVIVDGYYGVRITEIGAPTERALSIL